MSPFSFDYVIIIILITISKEKKTNNRDAEDFVIRNSILGNTVMELDIPKYDCVD